MNFISTWNNLHEHCIFADSMLIVSYVQDALQKDLLIAHSFSRALWNSYFGKVLLITFISAWKNLHEHCIFTDSLLTVSYVQDALRNELHIAPFLEHFKIPILGKFH